MNENLNLVEILKDCPQGTKLYSTIHGEVELKFVDKDEDHPIEVTRKGFDDGFTSDGRLYKGWGECTLFPSKEQRDWSKFKPKKQFKFDIKTLHSFDKVLVRDCNLENWNIQFFSYIMKYNKSHPYACIFDNYRYCIPYNEKTKHLVGTTDEAPEYYRYWEN